MKGERSVSLDLFRGLTICFMIIVNAPGSGADPYVPLDHAPWFGFTPTDLVFPSFLFAVGNALSFSKGRYERDGELLRKIFKRVLLIFLLGYLMYWFPFVHRLDGGRWAFNPLSHTRIMGVLQRIALCYGAGALIVHYMSGKASLWLSAFLLLGYWAVLYLFGLHGQELTMTHNAGTLFDSWLLGDNHLYHDKGGPIAFDPEGVLSTLPAVVNVIAGYQAGIFLREKGKNYESVARLMIVGALLVVTALFWAQFFPLAKKLWTSSFVLLTVGIDLGLLGLLIFAFDIKQWRWGLNFFQVLGKNPLAIYLLSELLLTTLQLVWVRPGLDFTPGSTMSFFRPCFPDLLVRWYLRYAICCCAGRWGGGWIKRRCILKYK